MDGGTSMARLLALSPTFHRRSSGRAWQDYRLSHRPSNEGRRVEHGKIIGSLTDLPTKEEAWKEVDRLSLRAFINRDAGPEVTMTKVLAEFMSKVHGMEYDISERKWKAVKDSQIGRA